MFYLCYYLEENKVLSKVMEKISSEYDELKKVDLKIANSFETLFGKFKFHFQVYEGMKCPKDDKIQALRSTAR